MPNKTFLETMNESFELLNPYEKAEFLKDKLGWAAACDLSAEVQKRMCHPIIETEHEHT